jgi:peptidyl-dipeptidase A
MSEIRSYLKHHERIVRPLYKDYNLRYWDLSLAGDNATLERALVAAKERYLHVYSNRQEFAHLQQWRKEAETLEPDEARQFKLIYDTFVPNQIEDEVLREIVARETQIENTFTTFRAEFEGGRHSDNQLRDILKTETNISRRKAAWEASKQIGAEIAPRLLELARIRNREARKLGYLDYYSMMFKLQELDETSVFSLFDSLELLSETAFSHMKAELDAALKARFGSSDVASYPWLYADPFFQEYPAAGGGEALDDVFKGRDVEALTKAHYESIGLDIGGLLQQADLYERDGKSQHAFCLDVDREGDVRVLCNIQKNERWMSTMLHEFGHAIYDRFHDDRLPFLLRTPAHTLTTEAIAMLNGRMSKEPAWLVRIAQLSEQEAARLTNATWKVLRSEMLIFLRWAITFVRFERALYLDPEQDLNRLWWEYVARIQKITPPPDRNSPDWASKIHLSGSPAYYQNYVLGELMASQVLEFIHQHVTARGSYVGDLKTGKFLVERIFKSGARHPWNTMLADATGESLNPKHFIQQFIKAESGIPRGPGIPYS